MFLAVDLEREVIQVMLGHICRFTLVNFLQVSRRHMISKVGGGG